MYRKDKYRDCIAGAVFTISAKDRDFGEVIRDTLSKSFGGIHVGWREYTDKRTNRDYIMIRSGRKEVSDWLQKHIHGRYARKKRFSEAVMRASLEEQRVIMRAMWRGDGSVYNIKREGRSDENVTTYTTASYELALQVHEMLLRQGLIYGINAGSHNSYQVKTNGGDPRNGFIEDGILWSTIHSLEPSGEYETFNLTVRDDPNYLTEAGIVHNCGAYSRPGEYQEVEYWYPYQAERIRRWQELVALARENQQWEIEQGVRKADEVIEQKFCRWGPKTNVPQEQMPIMPMCHFCRNVTVGEVEDA